ncbi:MAG: hypothetical protein ACXVRH_03885 [Thermoleophilaceae bacterium]
MRVVDGGAVAAEELAHRGDARLEQTHRVAAARGFSGQLSDRGETPARVVRTAPASHPRGKFARDADDAFEAAHPEEPHPGLEVPWLPFDHDGAQ